jgi:two-component system NtrC family sensor kinase
LTGILTFVEDLVDLAPDDSDQKKDLETILHETLRCRQIVRDLLDFSRQTAPNRQVVSLQPIVHQAVGLVRKQASFHNIRFDVNLAPAPLYVNADSNQIQQVMLNLIINARDAMNGTGELRIESGLAEEAGRVVVEVTDRGCGISRETLEQIFEPFFSTKGGRGNGLGLAAVHSIIEQHEGEITVDSVVGQGSTFRVSLPAVGPDQVPKRKSKPRLDAI